MLTVVLILRFSALLWNLEPVASPLFVAGHGIQQLAALADCFVPALFIGIVVVRT